MGKSINSTIFTVLLSALVILPVGCGFGTTTSCDFREGGVNGAEPRCQERSGFQGGETFKAACDALQAKPIDGPCPDDGIVLGCEVGGSDVIDWYYPPKTEDEVRADCDADSVVER